jgi:hypothetical protein
VQKGWHFFKFWEVLSSNPVKGFMEGFRMLRPEDVELILTTYDLSVFLKDMVRKEDRDLKINIDYESGEVFINCPGFPMVFL